MVVLSPLLLGLVGCAPVYRLGHQPPAELERLAPLQPARLISSSPSPGLQLRPARVEPSS